MNPLYKDFLFQKHIFVNDLGPDENVFEVWFSMADLFGIRVVKGRENLHRDMIAYAEEKLGKEVPKPFYIGFPQSVRALTSEQLLFDQLVHYAVTYGFGNFERPGHSVMEQDLERIAFREDARILDFEAVTEKEAKERLKTAAHDLSASTRPLNERDFAFLLSYLKDFGREGIRFASVDTRIRFLIETKDLSFADGLQLKDVLKVTERIYWARYKEEHWEMSGFSMKKLNLKNRERVFITALIRKLIPTAASFRECYERQAVWSGLLHHIHFVPQTPAEEAFASAMRFGKNASVYAASEKLIAENEPDRAALLLYREKGPGAVLRQADYLLSRGCSIACMTACMKECSSILLLQLLFRYGSEDSGRRAFTYTHLNLIRTYVENDEDLARRKSRIPEALQEEMREAILNELKRRYRNKLGKVWLSESMKNIALPISEASSQGGLGVLPKGSRLVLPAGKKLRAFVYWELVNDIDLSVIGLDENDQQYEFSWRTMAENQSDAITFSGDQTSGYKGGSEFFDIRFDDFRKKYPKIRHLIFAANVFSREKSFAECVCRAGYMFRDSEDSGEIFEPKTVSSAFTVNSSGSFAYLFALDLTTREFIWLNAAVNSAAPVAGETNITPLTRYFNSTRILSLYDLISMQASALVSDPEDADVVVSDETLPVKEGALLVHSYDIDVMMRLMETK